jgi:hypothetical protein
MRIISEWVENETKNVKINDKRLAKRFGVILNALGNHPNVSIPAASGGRNDMLAAYRFFNNDKVDFDTILSSHIKASLERIQTQPIVICANDTSEIDLTMPQQQVRGTGHLDGSKRRGFFHHPTEAFTPNGVALGFVHAENWVRPDPPSGSKKERQNERKSKSIDQKESGRWVRSYDAVCQLKSQASETQFVYVADSESDIYEMIAQGNLQSDQADFVIRACQNRALQSAPVDRDDSDQRLSQYLFDAAKKRPVLYTQKVQVRARTSQKVKADKSQKRKQNRDAREANIEVRATPVTLRAPKRRGETLPDITVHAVFAEERNVPEGEIPVRWVLLTSLPITDDVQVYRIIEYYQIRWLIEINFRTLKSLFKVESLQFETLDRYLTCFAVYMIATWRAMYICYYSRTSPDASCEQVFERSEWRSVYQFVHEKPSPDTPLTMQEMVRLIGGLGGWVHQKLKSSQEPGVESMLSSRSLPIKTASTEPGPQTLCIGLLRLHDISQCWDTFGPEARERCV